jgi:DNA-directed RNA polymerase specialized sigma24 family protein
MLTTHIANEISSHYSYYKSYLQKCFPNATANEITEVIHDTWARQHTIEPKSNLKALTKLALRHTYIRRFSSKVVFTTPDLLCVGHDFYKLELDKILSAFSPRIRDCVEAYYLGYEKVSEVAERYSVTVDAVGRCARRGLERLYQKYADDKLNGNTRC